MNAQRGEEMTEINAFWTWSGQYVGFRSSDCLFGPDGRQVGYFAEGDEIYASSGAYIGEIRGGNRLITNLSKKAWTRRAFVPRSLKSSPGRANVSPREMLAGFEDFRRVRECI